MPNTTNSFSSKNASPQSQSANKVSKSAQSVAGSQPQATTNAAKKQQQQQSHQPTRITDQDAIMQLLAEDVESRLEALLRTFIQEEKLRQEARYNSLMGKRSASLSALNSDYSDAGSPELSGADYSVSPISRSLYGQQLSRSGGGLTANKSNNNFGYVKPQQHRMQQSYQLHNSQNVNTPQQQKPTAIKTSHRLDASPSRSSSVQSNAPGSKVVVTRTRSPSPTGRQQSSASPNLFPVNRNNLFGQHQRPEQASKATSTTPVNKPTSYLNLHQRSQSPSKDGNQPANSSKSSQQQPQSSQLVSSKPSGGQPFLGHSSSHRLYAPSSNQSKFYDPFSTSSSQFGRSKDDSHIRRVVVYNLKDAASASEKKPVIIEQQQGLKSVNGTLNNGYAPNVTSGEKTETADNQAIRLRSAKTRANSPNRVGMLNGSGNMSAASGAAQIAQSGGAGKQAANSLATGRLSSPANTAGGKSSSGSSLASSLNSNTNSQAASKKLSASTAGSGKLAGSTVNSANSRLAAGHENAGSLQQFKDHNNLDSPHVGGGSAAQLNTERKVVRKLIVKELDGARNESAANSSGASGGSGALSKPTSSSTYQQQRLSPISNGDLNSVPTMAALNTQPAPAGNQLNHHPVSSLDALLSERDRILNNRDQYKQMRSNALASDVNNNYLLSMNSNKFNAGLGDLSPSSSLSGGSSSSAAGLLSSAGLSGNRTPLGGHQSSTTTNRNLPLSSSAASAKRKPLVDRYSPFSIVNEARQRFEETVKNGMNHPSPSSRFHSLDNSLENCDLDLNADPLDLSDELLFNELAGEQSDEEIVDSSMVLIRARLSRLLNGNGHNVNVASLPNSAILSLLNHLSNTKQTDHQPLTLPACLAELKPTGDEPLNASHNTPFSLLSPNSAPLSTPSPSIAAINSMRPPLVITNPSDCMRNFR